MSDIVTADQAQIKAEIILVKERARHAGLDFDQICIDDQGQRDYLKAQIDILKMAAQFVVIYAPSIYVVLKVIAMFTHSTLDVNENQFLAFEYANLSAVMAFGFGSGITALVQHSRHTNVKAIAKGIFRGDISMPPTQLKDMDKK